MTIIEPDFIRFRDTKVTTKFPVAFTVLLSKVALTCENFVGEMITDAMGVSAERSFPIRIIKLSVVIADAGFRTLSSFMTILLTKVALPNRLLIVNCLPATVHKKPVAESMDSSEIVIDI
jgi:hypothetical protein